MLKKILNLDGVREIGKETQRFIVGASARCDAVFCAADGSCPPGSTCSNGLCECDNGGGGDPGDDCNEPKRICQPWETGCGCVYV